MFYYHVTETIFPVNKFNKDNTIACGVIANETPINQRPNDVVLIIYR